MSLLTLCLWAYISMLRTHERDRIRLIAAPIILEQIWAKHTSFVKKFKSKLRESCGISDRMSIQPFTSIFNFSFSMFAKEIGVHFVKYDNYYLCTWRWLEHLFSYLGSLRVGIHVMGILQGGMCVKRRATTQTVPDIKIWGKVLLKRKQNEHNYF